jgi:hypothetical protein
MTTIIQTLKWPEPGTISLAPPPTGDPKHLLLDEASLDNRLVNGDWQRIGYMINWFTVDADSAVHDSPYNTWNKTDRFVLHSAYASAMKVCLGGPILRPHLPINQASPVPTTMAWTTLNKEDAFSLWAQHVGHSLAVEQLRLVPWSVSTFDSFSLDDLFNAANFFTKCHAQGSYELASATPCAPPSPTPFFETITCSAIPWARPLGRSCGGARA